MGKKLLRYERMEDVFIPTSNVKKFNALADMLMKNAGGTTSMGMVEGEAGRGKSFAAKRYAVQNIDSVYVYYLTDASAYYVYASIAEQVANIRPRSTKGCLQAIKEATKFDKKLVIIDEADKANVKVIDALRDMNEICQIPVLLVGESKIRDIINREKRLRSRILDIVEFNAIGPGDIKLFYETIFDGVEVDVKALKVLYSRSKGDFRAVVRDAKKVARLLEANNSKKVTEKLLEAI